MCSSTSIKVHVCVKTTNYKPVAKCYMVIDGGVIGNHNTSFYYSEN